jgi:hypothetical protein
MWTPKKHFSNESLRAFALLFSRHEIETLSVKMPLSHAE